LDKENFIIFGIYLSLAAPRVFAQTAAELETLLATDALSYEQAERIHHPAGMFLKCTFTEEIAIPGQVQENAK